MRRRYILPRARHAREILCRIKAANIFPSTCKHEHKNCRNVLTLWLRTIVLRLVERGFNKVSGEIHLPGSVAIIFHAFRLGYLRSLNPVLISWKPNDISFSLAYIYLRTNQASKFYRRIISYSLNVLIAYPHF